MVEKSKTFMKRVLEIIKKPEMRILPGQLAFFLLLSIIPLFAIIAVVAAKFSLSIESLIQVINQNLPKEVADFIIQIIGGKSISMNIVIFCVSGFILASNGPHSMIISSNILYKVKDKDFLTRRIKAILMTIILVILFLFVLAVPAFGDKIVNIIVSLIANDKIGKAISIGYNILKYPTSILIIFFFIKLLYTMAPDTTIKSKDTTTGAFVTTIGWIISTEVYSFYVSSFAKYNLLYGSVANLIILFLWIYLLSYIFVLGMALNASSHIDAIDKNND
ncbi:MAG: YihY/virulence factor BrkB family protein [Tenericutes bacterium]|nr:YihY/virulence factor BrkB family protein [Mycoplasmatota bacterium]